MYHPTKDSYGPKVDVHTPAIVDSEPFPPVVRAWHDSTRGPNVISAVHKQTTPSSAKVSRVSTRSKFIKVRVSPDEYAAIALHADVASQSMSEYLREQVLAVHRTLDLKAELVALRGLVSAPNRSTDDHLALEAVLLLRELAAARDAQILSRVRAQLAQRKGSQS